MSTEIINIKHYIYKWYVDYILQELLSKLEESVFVNNHVSFLGVNVKTEGNKFVTSTYIKNKDRIN